MKKNDQELLDSWAWYFVDVNIEQEKGKERIIIDQQEYNTLIDWLNNDGKFLKVGKNHYFWSKIDSFWPIQFEEWVLTALKSMDEPTQEFIKKRIRLWFNIYTLEKLRTEVSYFLSR